MEGVSVENKLRSTVNPLISTETIGIKVLRMPEADEVQAVLSDFQLLDFAKNRCEDSSDVINYNEGKEANQFVKIASYYGRKKNVFHFVSMLRDEEMLKKITEIVESKCDAASAKKFMERLDIYLDRIKKGEDDVKECLKGDDFPGAFFHGYYSGSKRNVHENLNINFTQPEQSLEVSSVFTNRIKRMEAMKSELRKVKIYNNGERVATVVKNKRQQRNYSFTKDGSCQLTVSWVAEDEDESSHNCSIIFEMNFGKISDVKLEIDGKDALPNESFNLVRQNDGVLIEGETLLEILEKYFK